MLQLCNYSQQLMQHNANSTMRSGDGEIAVIGGGLVGMAVAYGLLRTGANVSVFDEDDTGLRASRGNFGLIWVQGKGAQMPNYARWSRRSAALWPEFAAELLEYSGRDVEISQPGGFIYCLNDAEAQASVARLQGLQDALDGDYPFEYLGHNQVREMVPEVGPDVIGATWFPEDGHVNPLYLLHALHVAFKARGGRLINGASVRAVTPHAGGFVVQHGHASTSGFARVVLCAGLGNAGLAPALGLDAPVKPNRGQILVTERLKQRLHFPSVTIRQVGEGAIQIGDSKEDVGFDDRTDAQMLAKLARRAISIYPFLRDVRMVRAWGALRVMSADGHPIYEQSTEFPGAAVATCHSGVTLAAVHALTLAPWLLGQSSPIAMETFSAARFSKI
jgi:glycine/D-amino acid oxidase-like deaminating enzyme